MGCLPAFNKIKPLPDNTVIARYEAIPNCVGGEHVNPLSKSGLLRIYP
jgi:hypothetical protein